MKIAILALLSSLGFYLSMDHLTSFALGFAIASTSALAYYAIAGHVTRIPHLALFLLICGALAKLTVTVIGVMIGVKTSLITSPLIFSYAYLFFLIAITFLLFARFNRKLERRQAAMA